jgi:hypothetical protein
MRSIRASARGVDRIEEDDGRRSTAARSAPVRPRVSSAIRPETGASASDLFPVARARCRKTTRVGRAARNAPAGDAGASDDGRERRGGHGEGSHFDV